MTRNSALLAVLLHAAGIGAACLVGGTFAAAERTDARWIAVELPSDAATPEAAEQREPKPEVAVAPPVETLECEPVPDAPFPDPPPAPTRQGDLRRPFDQVSDQRIVPPAASAEEPAHAEVEPVVVPATNQPSAPSAVDVDPAPIAAVNEPPVYPYMDWRRGHQGTVVLELSIDARGRVTAAQVVRSSGWRGLDGAARDKLSGWRFEPALRDGRPAATVFRQSVEFRIVTDGSAPSAGVVTGGGTH